MTLPLFFMRLCDGTSVDIKFNALTIYRTFLADLSPLSTALSTEIPGKSLCDSP